MCKVKVDLQPSSCSVIIIIIIIIWSKAEKCYPETKQQRKYWLD